VRRALAVAALALCAGGASGTGARPVTVGSKAFTEGVILGEVLTQTLRGAGIAAVHRRELGGTRVVWNALRAGQVDAYVEYTGTLRHEILAGQAGPDADLAAALRAHGVALGTALGFANTYALAVRADTARTLGLTRIGDLTAHAGARVGISHEFHDRADGWPGLARAYGLPQRPAVLDHDLAYRAIAAGTLDVVDAYTTDAEIPHYDLTVLADERGYFPRYDAVVVMRADLPPRGPAARWMPPPWRA
jgi:osmoprotectant transport system permease protein